MYASKSILLALTFGCVVCANADVLESWGDGSQGTEWDWNFEQNRLTILRGDGNDYKFWVHDGSEEPGTGVINNITVDPGATGDFTLLIQHPSGAAGAENWNAGDLRYAGGTSTVVGVKLDGALSDPGHEVILDLRDGGPRVRTARACVSTLAPYPRTAFPLRAFAPKRCTSTALTRGRRRHGIISTQRQAGFTLSIPREITHNMMYGTSHATACGEDYRVA